MMSPVSVAGCMLVLLFFGIPNQLSLEMVYPTVYEEEKKTEHIYIYIFVNEDEGCYDVDMSEASKKTIHHQKSLVD